MSVIQPTIDEIFSEALSRAEPAARAAYLDSVCRANPALRARVDALLAAHAAPDPFLRTRAASDVASNEATHAARGGSSGSAFIARDPSVERVGGTIDNYRLLQELGEGGFGVVFLAEQREPVERKVALKVIKAGMDTRAVIARFEAERQALAMMDHPNIARVLDAGQTPAGRPYFAMELVRGDPITTYCVEKRLNVRARLALFIDVCRAVQHAHQKAVIHRDLKPSNVLVSVSDGRALPKVIDFGIAKATNRRLTDKTLFTEVGQFVGTPAYMSPEQADMSGGDVDTRSDIYSLGVLLYELLTGTTPFEINRLKAVSASELQRIIQHEAPPRPSARLSRVSAIGDAATLGMAEPARVARQIRGDLDWIVMKCLEKDPARRYETATGLTRDIERYLANEPVLASPPSTLYLFRKFVQRNRGWVGVATTVVVGLLALTTWALIERAKATGALVDAESARAQAEFARTESEKLRAAAELAHARVAAKHTTLQSVQNITQQVIEFATTAGPRGSFSENPSGLVDPRDIARRLAEYLEADDSVDAEAEAFGHMRLASILRATREYSAAEKSASRAVELYRKLDPDHPELADALGVLGACQLMSGAPQAEENLKAALERDRAAGNKKGVAEILNVMGRAFHQRNQFEKAAQAFRESLSVAKSEFGDESEQVATTTNNLALLIIQTGDLAAGEKLLREALAMRLALFGEKSEDVFEIQNSLAALLGMSQRHADSEREYLELLSHMRAELGEDHPHVAHVLGHLGELYRGPFRDPAKAEPLVRESFERLRKKFGHANPAVDQSRRRLGRVLDGLERWSEAKELHEDSLRILSARYEANHPGVVIAKLDLGATLVQLQEFAAAEPLLVASETALRANRATLAPYHNHAVQNLTALYAGWNKAEPNEERRGIAERWRAEAESLTRAPASAPATAPRPATSSPSIGVGSPVQK